MKKKLLFSLLLTLFFSGCGLLNPTPNWVTSGIAPQNGNVYGIGSCIEHINGENHQRALAISYAIDDIARQNGVQVDTSLERIRTTNNNSSSSASKEYSVQTVNGQTVSARIVEVWKDKKTKKIHILMVQN